MITEFSLDLRSARRKAGLTQMDCAHLLGVRQSTISEYERGTSKPTMERICMLSLIFGRSFESYFGPSIDDAKKLLGKRLRSIPKIARPTLATKNRVTTLKRLRDRLAPNPAHGRR